MLENLWFSRASGKLELLDELFEQVKPGLSSYENDIDGGVDSIRQLLTHAEQTIPTSKWADTPLELKATAGLRLLPEEKANAILDGTRDLLKNSGFKGTSLLIFISFLKGFEDTW